MTFRAKIEQITEQGWGGGVLVFFGRDKVGEFTPGERVFKASAPSKNNTFPSKNAKVCVLTCKNRVSNKPCSCEVSLGLGEII